MRCSFRGLPSLKRLGNSNGRRIKAFQLGAAQRIRLLMSRAPWLSRFSSTTLASMPFSVLDRRELWSAQYSVKLHMRWWNKCLARFSSASLASRRFFSGNVDSIKGCVARKITVGMHEGRRRGRSLSVFAVHII